MEPVDLDEDDEVEMTVGELQSWIRLQVENNELLRLRQTQLAQVKSLVERRELQAASTRALFKRTYQAVVECEHSLKDLYCELGMDYRDTDSEDDESSTSDIIEIDGSDDAAAVPYGGASYSRSVVECETGVKDLYHQLGMNDRYGDPKGGESTSSCVIEIDNDTDDAMPVDSGEEDGDLCWEVRLSSLSWASASLTRPPVAAPEIVTASESEGELDLIASGEQQQPDVPERNPGSPDEQSGPEEKGAGDPHQSSLQTHLSCDAMDIDSHSKQRPLSVKEPNDSDASSQKFQPQRKGSVRLAARLSRMKTQSEVAVQRKPQSVVSSATIGQTKPGRALSDEEMFSSEDSDASWEPSDSDSSPRAKRRTRGKYAPKKHQSSGKGPTSGKPQKGNRSTPSTKPQEANKGSSCVLPPAPNPATQPPARSPAPTPATQPPAQSPAPSPATQPPAGPQAPNPATQPPAGLPEEVVREGMVVLARRRTGTWHQGKIVEIKPAEKGHKYKVDFEEQGRSRMSGHHIAFNHPPLLERLYVGARVVAKYKEPEGDQSWFYSGTLAELPNRRNQMRFLVFFDDGTPSYLPLPVLHLVCRPLQHGWEDDIEDKSFRDCLLYYLDKYPNQPMAHYNIGQQINVEYNGSQRRCRVEATDSSLLHVLFLDDQHKEWVYRGSMRLQHMANMRKAVSGRVSACKTGESSTAITSEVPSSSSCRAQSEPEKRSAPSDSNESGAASETSVVTYTPHKCSPACLKRTPDVEHRGRNPLLIPMLYEFNRKKSCMRSDGKGSFRVLYSSPCGLNLTTMGSVQEYLWRTQCDFLSIDMFCLDTCVSVSSLPTSSNVLIDDLNQGKEDQPFSCVNEVNNVQHSGSFTYCKDRVDSSVVNVNTSPDSMVGCDCTNGCTDRSRCSCHKLTIQSTVQGSGIINTGYNFKKLEKQLTTGVFECNAQCHCDPRLCSNRVAQNGIQLRLQVFMTQKKGWGVRCLDDVAKGSFICCYVGRIVTSDKPTLESNVYCVKMNPGEKGKPQVVDKSTNRKSKLLQKGSDNKSEDKERGKRKKEDLVTTQQSVDKGLSYIIDSSKEGNVARYLNHSCSPNLFVQKVFVDTHDHRFPWVAFFAKHLIRAGTELTWNYRSEADTLEGVTRFTCCCGSSLCIGTL